LATIEERGGIVTSDTALEKSLELAPVLRERARSTEQARRIPDETMAALKDSGLLRLLQPSHYGGAEADPQDYLEAVYALSAADSSVGWVYSVLASHAWVAAYFPEQAMEELWGQDHGELIATTTLAKAGSIEKVDSGYRIRGRFGFASGCDHASWVLIFGIASNAVEDGRIWCLVPRSNWEIDDNWHVMGLCGTGSCDLLFDAEVPAYRTITQNAIGSAVSDSPLYRLPLFTLFAHAPALPIIGAAQGALDSFVESQRDRVDLLGARPAADPFVQAAVAESGATLRAARSNISRNFAELMSLVASGSQPSIELFQDMELDRVLAVREAVACTERLFTLAGGRATSLDSPLQRAWRDVHAGAAHAANQTSPRLLMSGASAFGIGAPPSGRSG
jgi:3-hydroxy-9,10-secoandrosta-1,3,5(10)-triene-9,17-dione monooxygenase